VTSAGVLLVLTLTAQVPVLPAAAVVLEERQLPSNNHPPRALVLWMLSPQPSECPSAEDYAPSCPDETRGCYWRGPTRVSLIDPVHRRVINTVNITEPVNGEDSFDVPRRLYSNGPYHVDHDHRPTILWLRDYNHDGVRTEFALFDRETCSDLFTALFGHSSRQDRVIQYRVRTSDPEGDGDIMWPEALFATSRRRDGVWRYELAWPPGDVPCRKCEARYRPADEAFDAVCRIHR